MAGSVIRDHDDLRRALLGAVADRSQVVPLARLLATPCTLRWLIASVRDDACRLERAASASQRHPLGFDKYVLHSSTGCQLRLHVWWPWEAHAREDVHDHRFDFGSCVIAGTLKVETFALDRAGEPMDAYREEHRGIGGSYRFTPAGPVGVRSHTSMVLQAGSAYFTSSDVLHRVTADVDDATVTIVIKLPRRERPHTTVLVASGSVPLQRTRRLALTADELRERLRCTERILEPLADGRQASA